MTRWCRGKDGEKKARVLAAMLLTAWGTPFLYYGEEIGMKNGAITRRQIRDPVGIKYWPLNKGRDPERTPMQWSADANAGFSAAEPWLPVADTYREVNVRPRWTIRARSSAGTATLLALRKESGRAHARIVPAGILRPGRAGILPRGGREEGVRGPELFRQTALHRIGRHVPVAGPARDAPGRRVAARYRPYRSCSLRGRYTGTHLTRLNIVDKTFHP